MKIKNFVVNLYKGRLSRSEFLESLFVFLLLYVPVVALTIFVMSFFVGPAGKFFEIFRLSIFSSIFLAMMVISYITIFSLFIRRLNDIAQDKQVYIVALFVPFVNVIFLLFLFFKSSRDTFRNPERTGLGILFNSKGKIS